MFQVNALSGSAAVVGVGAVAADTRSRRRPGTGCRRSGDEIVAVGDAAGADRDRRGERGVDAVGDSEPRLIGARGRVGVRRVGRGRGGPVAERSTSRSAAGPRDRTSRRSRTPRSSGVGPEVGFADARHDRRLVRLHVLDPAQLAHAEGAADVGIPEVEVVEGAVGSLGEVDDVAVGAVRGAVGGLEVERAGDVAVARRTSGP